jgi:subtilisin family serine protease
MSKLVKAYEPYFDNTTKPGDTLVIRHTSLFSPTTTKKEKRLSATLSVSTLGVSEYHTKPHVVAVFKHTYPKLHTTPYLIDDVFSPPPPLMSSYAGPDQILAVGDTGLDINHCFFYDPLTTPNYSTLAVGDPVVVPDAGHKKVRAYIRICTDLSETCDPTDFTDFPNGHGTHVTGIALGQVCLGRRGVSPSARVLVYDMASGTNIDTISLPVNLDDLFTSIILNGATAMTVSWGSGCSGAYDYLAEQFDAFVVQNPQLHIQVAAGNCGSNIPNGMGSPATALNVMSVGSVALSVNAYPLMSYPPRGFVSYTASYETAADFSSMGPTPDGRFPLVSLAGIGVVSADSQPSEGPNHADFIAMSGTSMATPALPTLEIKALFPNLTQYASDVHALELVMASTSVTQVVSYATGVTTNDEVGGQARSYFGSVTVNTSLSYAATHLYLNATPIGVACFEGPIDPTQPVLVSAVWLTPPVIPMLFNLLINTADLYVTPEDGVGGPNGDLRSTTNFKRTSIVRSTPTKLRAAVIAPTVFVEWGLVSVAVSNAVLLPATECAFCSLAEPPQQCTVTNGMGWSFCGGECLPSTCATGTQLAIGGCSAYSSSGLTSCSSPYEVYNGTACVCTYVRVCSDGGAITNCDLDPPPSCNVATTITTAGYTEQELPQPLVYTQQNANPEQGEALGSFLIVHLALVGETLQPFGLTVFLLCMQWVFGLTTILLSWAGNATLVAPLVVYFFWVLSIVLLFLIVPVSLRVYLVVSASALALQASIVVLDVDSLDPILPVWSAILLVGLFVIWRLQ